MKHKPLHKKTQFLFLSSLFLFALCSCGQNSVNTPSTTNTPPAPSTIVTPSVSPLSNNSPQSSEDISPTPDDVSKASDDALVEYNNFLNGSINAEDSKHEISDGIIKIEDISLEPDLETYYAFFDMNGDGIPELHLRPTMGGTYVIFTYQNDQIVLYHQGPDYESPLNNGAILYERDGAAPTHVNYYYLVLDSDGNELSRVNFSKYHSIDQSGMNESPNYDVFMFEDKEISEDEWNSLTNEYLSISSDLITWNEM